MAKVAKQWLVWVSEPKLDAMGNPSKTELGDLVCDRIEVAMDAVVPDTVPGHVLADWEARDLIFEDPTKEHVAAQEGPPRVTLPPVLSQKFEQQKKMGLPMRGGIPPRPVNVKSV